MVGACGGRWRGWRGVWRSVGDVPWQEDERRPGCRLIRTHYLGTTSEVSITGEDTTAAAASRLAHHVYIAPLLKTLYFHLGRMSSLSLALSAGLLSENRQVTGLPGSLCHRLGTRWRNVSILFVFRLLHWLLVSSCLYHWWLGIMPPANSIWGVHLNANKILGALVRRRPVFELSSLMVVGLPKMTEGASETLSFGAFSCYCVRSQVRTVSLNFKYLSNGDYLFYKKRFTTVTKRVAELEYIHERHSLLEWSQCVSKHVWESTLDTKCWVVCFKHQVFF